MQSKFPARKWTRTSFNVGGYSGISSWLMWLSIHSLKSMLKQSSSMQKVLHSYLHTLALSLSLSPTHTHTHSYSSTYTAWSYVEAVFVNAKSSSFLSAYFGSLSLCLSLSVSVSLSPPPHKHTHTLIVVHVLHGHLRIIQFSNPCCTELVRHNHIHSLTIRSSSRMQTHSHSTDHWLRRSVITTNTYYHIPLHSKENTHRSVTTLKMPSCVLHTTGRILTVRLKVVTTSTSSCQGVKFTPSKFPGLNSVPGMSSLALSLKTDSHRLVFNTVMTTWQRHVVVMPTFFQTLDTNTPQPIADK